MRFPFRVSFAETSRTIWATNALAAKREFLRLADIEVTSEVWFATEVEVLPRLQAA